jgi:glycerol-3-phosphate cytidylyltransferase-like family protein
LAAAHSLDEIRAAAATGPAALAGLLLPIDAGLDGMPAAALTASEVAAVSRGQQVKPAQPPHVEAEARVRLLAEDGSLLGIGSWKGGRLVPEKVFVGPPTPAGSTAGVAGATVKIGSKPAVEQRLRVVDPHNRMVVVPGISALEGELGRLYIAVGVFDGLHRGHLYLLRELTRAARRAGARPAVITFDAHPEELIEGLAPPLLCDPDERLVRLQAAGVEVTVVQHFDHALRMTPYDAFVASIREKVEVAGFVMTPDAAFGYERGGTPETLTALGQREGFAVTVVPSFLSNGEQVRSSEIRRRISVGDLAGARSLLGRDHGFTGRLDAAGEAAAEPSEDAAVRLAFELPVALPPAGRYPALVGPAWKIGRKPAPASIVATATVDDGQVSVAAPEGSTMAEVRVVLLASQEGGGRTAE